MNSRRGSREHDNLREMQWDRLRLRSVRGAEPPPGVARPAFVREGVLLLPGADGAVLAAHRDDAPVRVVRRGRRHAWNHSVDSKRDSGERVLSLYQVMG